MKSTTAGQADSRNNAQHMCSLRSVLNLRGKTEHVVVDAEDALIAALKVKIRRPEVLIAPVRQQNKRGDTRHPMRRLRESLVQCLSQADTLMDAELYSASLRSRRLTRSIA
jgi:hypothetical protein